MIEAPIPQSTDPPIAATWVAGTHPLACPPRYKRARPLLTALAFFALVFGVFFTRARVGAEFFPLYVDGESAVAMTEANNYIAGYREGHLLDALQNRAWHYNNGLALILAPIWERTAPSLVAYETFFATFWALMIASFLVLFARNAAPGSEPRPSRREPALFPWLLAPLGLMGFALASERGYKWHCAALIAELAIFLIAAAIGRRGTRAWGTLIGGLLLYAISFPLYHGNVIFLPALTVICILQIASGGHGWRGEVKAMVALGFSSALAVFVLSNWDRSFLLERIATEVSAPHLLNMSAYDFYFGRNLHRMGEALTLYFSPALLIIFAIGLCCILWRFRRDGLARATLFLLGNGLVATFFCTDVVAPDQNCWMMLPVIGLAAYGLLAIALAAAWLPLPRWIGAVAMAVLAVTVGRAESVTTAAHHLYWSHDWGPDPGLTGNQLALVLRELSDDAGDADPNALYFVPGEQISEEQGGFRHQIPADLFDWRKRTRRTLRYFDSYEALAAEIRNYLASPRRPASLRIYLSLDPAQPDKLPPACEQLLSSYPCEVRVHSFLPGMFPDPMRCHLLILKASGKPDS